MAISKLTESIYSVGDQFPKEVQDKRRELLPAKKSAIRSGKRAVFSYDKLYIDGVLYKPPVNQNAGNSNASGGHRTPGRSNDTVIPGNSGQARNNRFSPQGDAKPKTPPFSSFNPEDLRFVSTRRVLLLLHPIKGLGPEISIMVILMRGRLLLGARILWTRDVVRVNSL